MIRWSRACAITLASVVASWVPGAQAQSTDVASSYPDRPVRIIVGLGPGTPPDVRARQIAQKLSAQWRQSVIVENRPGAGGQVAMEFVSRSAADGYTLGMASQSTLTIMPHLRKLPFDPLKDFVPVTGIGFAPILLLANGTLPVDSARELIEHAKRKPGALNAASFGEATINHLALEQFNRANGVRITHVPYGDGARAAADLTSGQVQLSFDFLHLTRPHVRSGRLKALAVSGSRRLAAYPEIPTFTEAGVSGMDTVGGWLGIVAPANTPASIVRKLHAAVARAFEEPELLAQITELGAEAYASSPDEFAAFIRSEHARWGRLIADAGIRLE